MNGTSDPNARMNDAERRIAQTIVIGTISQVDYRRGRYRVKSGEIETGWLPLAQNRAAGVRTWEPRHVGEQVIIASPSGDLAQGVVMASLPTDQTGHVGKNGETTKTIFADGFVIEHNAESKAMTITGPGGATITTQVAGCSVVLTEDTATVTATDIKLDGNVEVTGDFWAKGDMFRHRAKDVGDEHLHKDVEPGAGLSGVPV